LYYGRVVNEEALRARFDVIAIEGEGILLDREGGGVIRLNRTACEIWTAILEGQTIAGASRELARRFGLTADRAGRDVALAIDQIPDAPRAPSTDPCRWEAVASGYAFFEGPRLLCEIDGSGSSLRLAGGVHPTEAEARGYLKTVAPKLLSLRGVFVLHASAVELDGKLLVFSGRSGAGKTTSARAFARAGARLVSEDLLVMAAAATSPAEPRAVIGGEAVILAWIFEQAAQLARAPETTISCAALDRCVDGPVRPLVEILLVDANRRAGQLIQREELAGPDALVALLESAFFASPDARAWRARFVQLHDLVAGTVASRVTMPGGLATLDSAARAYRQMATTAS
jgi:hypothetical protein